jgi:hypothetical protein
MSKRRTSQRKKLSRKQKGGVGWHTGECGWSQHLTNPRKHTWHKCKGSKKKCRFRDQAANFHWPQGQNFGPDEKGTIRSDKYGIHPKTNQQPDYRVLHKERKNDLGKCF